MESAGIEPGRQSSSNHRCLNESGAKSGALGDREARSDREFAAVVEAWPTLPDEIKAGILAIIQVAKARRSSDE
jgi:hypothetical protein